MKLNILLLPLLGGYLFIKSSYYFRLRAIRYNNQELLLSSSAAGLCGLAPAYLIVILLSYLTPHLTTEWHRIFNFSYSGTAFIAFFLLVLAIPIEWWWHNEEEEIIKVIREENDAIENIFLKSLQDSKLLSITLKNRKVYVGFISQNFFTPYQNLKSIKIIPVISGVRKDSSLKIDFTTIYDPIVNYVDQNENIELNIDDFEIGLPLNEILSVNVFDFRVYNMFQEADPDQQEFNFE